MINRDNINKKITNLENNQRQKKFQFLKPEKPNICEIKV